MESSNSEQVIKGGGATSGTTKAKTPKGNGNKMPKSKKKKCCEETEGNPLPPSDVTRQDRRNSDIQQPLNAVYVPYGASPHVVNQNTDSVPGGIVSQVITTTYIVHQPSHMPQQLNQLSSTIVPLPGDLGQNAKFSAGSQIDQQYDQAVQWNTTGPPRNFATQHLSGVPKSFQEVQQLQHSKSTQECKPLANLGIRSTSVPDAGRITSHSDDSNSTRKAKSRQKKKKKGPSISNQVDLPSQNVCATTSREPLVEEEGRKALNNVGAQQDGMEDGVGNKTSLAHLPLSALMNKLHTNKQILSKLKKEEFRDQEEIAALETLNKILTATVKKKMKNKRKRKKKVKRKEMSTEDKTGIEENNDTTSRNKSSAGKKTKRVKLQPSGQPGTAHRNEEISPNEISMAKQTEARAGVTERMLGRDGIQTLPLTTLKNRLNRYKQRLSKLKQQGTPDEKAVADLESIIQDLAAEVLRRKGEVPERTEVASGIDSEHFTNLEMIDENVSENDEGAVLLVNRPKRKQRIVSSLLKNRIQFNPKR